MKLTVVLLFTLTFFWQNAFARNDNNCEQKISRQSYMHKGSADSGTAADKLYNFDKLRKDIKEQLISTDKIDDKKVMCMHELFNKGIADSSKYWADRGASEGCFNGDKIPPTRPNSCSENTWKEFRKSRQYLKKLQEELKKDLQPLASAAQKGKEVNPSCAPTAPLKREPLADLFKTAEEARTNLCCGSQSDKAGAVRAVYPDINYNQCLAKIKETNEEMISVKGLAMCSANVVAEAVKTIWESIKGLWNSLSELSGMMSTMKELLTNKDAREQFVNNLQKTVKEFLASRGVTFNQCLNQYEQSMYICEVTGNVIGGMVDIGAVAKLYKVVRAGKAAGEITDFLRKSPKGAAVLDNLKKAEDFTTSAAGKAKSVAKETADKVVQQLAKDTRAYSLAAQMLAKDVSFDYALRSELKKPKTEIKTEVKVAAKAEAPKVEAPKAEAPARIAGSEQANLPDSSPAPSPAPAPVSAPQLARTADVTPSPSPSPSPAPAPVRNDPLPGSRDHRSYQFEVGEDVAIPRSDGTFTRGKIASEHIDDQGVKRYVTQFETPDGDIGRKIISKDDLHEQYGRFYNGEKANLIDKPSTPAAPVASQRPRIAQDNSPLPGSRDHKSYQFEPGEEVMIPRSDGSFTKGRVASEFMNADGSKSYVTMFQTADGEWARKVMRKDDLHEQYGRFYNGEKADLRSSAAPAAVDDVLPPAADFKPAPKVAKKADVEDAVVVRETTRPAVVETPRLPAPARPLQIAAPAKVETPKVEAAPKLTASPSSAPSVRREALPADPSNQLHHLNQKAGYENFRMNDKQRDNQALQLGITDTNRIHAQDYIVNRSAKELDDVLSKAFAKEDGIDVKSLRQMLAHAPENGYVSLNEFAQAKKFVELLEKKGGSEYLKKLGLNNTQIDNMNYLLERVPLYAKYADPDVKTSFSLLDKKVDVIPEPEAPAPVRKSMFDGIKISMTKTDKPEVTGNQWAANKVRLINEGSNARLNDNQRRAEALSLGITDDNRMHAIDFKVNRSRKEIDGVLGKVLGENNGIDAQELRRMMAHGPESGYVSPSEFNQAKKFVQEIEKRGGNDYLKSLNLSHNETQTMNYLIERVPHYAEYSDKSVKATLQRLEAPAVKIETPASTPAAPATPSPLSQVKVPKESKPVNEAVEAAAEKVRSSSTSKVAYINERDGYYSRGMTDRQRSQQALELGITDDNRIAAIEFKAPSTNKEAEKVFAKVLPPGINVNAKELRAMLSFSPGSGYQRELHHATRLVKAIENAGGIEALKTKGLSRSEAQTLNKFLERIPEYARYADPDLKSSLRTIPLPEATVD